MFKTRLLALFFIVLAVAIGYFDYVSQTSAVSWMSKFPFKLGLDLNGGTHLVYKADISAITKGSVKDSMSALREVIERRINIFGVSEPIVQVEEALALTGAEERLIVELPGITNVGDAVAMIGATPVLEFKTERAIADRDRILAPIGGMAGYQKGGFNPSLIKEDPFYVNTELSGRFLKKATLDFGGSQVGSLSPSVALEFNTEGGQLFEQITKDNVGKTVAIYLDGVAISTPVVREAIPNGKAVISGNFTPEEAKILVGRLNAGALPIPISLLSTQTIGPSLGQEAINKSIAAAIYSFLAIIIFLIIWYRLPGFLASISLTFYVVLMLALFKLIPVTLTSAGLAGFILSIGMAVDANILIFSRIREELVSGSGLENAIRSGSARAWTSIRDSNLSSIITAIILFWMGTSLVKGFALVFGLGVLVSMFSGITVTNTLLVALGFKEARGFVKFLFGIGLRA
ncbi:MAG: protein translocase subunit SecD [Candidatus Paceibacterota bacterium]|jgi:protein-export membrane protein SecD